MEVIVKQLGAEYNRSTFSVPPRHTLTGKYRAKVAAWVITCVPSIDEFYLCMWLLDRVRNNKKWSVQMAAVLIANKTHASSTLSNARAIEKHKWNVDTGRILHEEISILKQVGWHVPLLMVSTCILEMCKLFVGVAIDSNYVQVVSRDLIVCESKLCGADVCTRAIQSVLCENYAAAKYWIRYTRCLYNSF